MSHYHNSSIKPLIFISVTKIFDHFLVLPTCTNFGARWWAGKIHAHFHTKHTTHSNTPRILCKIPQTNRNIIFLLFSRRRAKLLYVSFFLSFCILIQKHCFIFSSVLLYNYMDIIFTLGFRNKTKIIFTINTLSYCVNTFIVLYLVLSSNDATLCMFSVFLSFTRWESVRCCCFVFCECVFITFYCAYRLVAWTSNCNEKKI